MVENIHSGSRLTSSENVQCIGNGTSLLESVRDVKLYSWPTCKSLNRRKPFEHLYNFNSRHFSTYHFVIFIFSPEMGCHVSCKSSWPIFWEKIRNLSNCRMLYLRRECKRLLVVKLWQLFCSCMQHFILFYIYCRNYTEHRVDHFPLF